MKERDWQVSSQLDAALLIAFSLLGASVVYLSTTRYGMGISPDSVGYIGIARNLVAGNGFVSYDGTILVVQPPLYSTLLASFAYLVGSDPLVAARWVHILLFGALVYLSGQLAFAMLPGWRAVALGGALIPLVAGPLLESATMALSELLFINCTLLFLLAWARVTKNRKPASLVWLAVWVALACLTRYIGITLLLTGALFLLLFSDQHPKLPRRLWLLLLLATLPLGVWLIRNYSLTGTLTGERPAAVFTLGQNLLFTYDTLSTWYIPRESIGAQPLRVLVGLLIGLAVLWPLRYRFRRPVNAAVIPLTDWVALFVLVYIGFLVISSASTGFDRIGNRLLVPLYLPVTLLLLAGAAHLLAAMRQPLAQRLSTFALLLILVVWLSVSGLAVLEDTRGRLRQGAGGYNRQSWRESTTIRYLQEHTRALNCSIYSNAPDALYILTDRIGKMSPARRANSSPAQVATLAELRATWPPEAAACLIWLNRQTRDYLYTVDELQRIATMSVVVQLDDGAIYTVSKKE